jgi:hypothetical protein
MPVLDTFETSRDVRYSVAIGVPAQQANGCELVHTCLGGRRFRDREDGKKRNFEAGTRIKRREMNT